MAGYIVVSDSHGDMPISYAPITRTDGPDRPFLVRTTDTKWLIPHGLVRALYPQIEDTFNWVDSKEDWRNLGIGSKGAVGNFSWEWVENEPSALNEWELANDKNLMLDQEGMEKSDRENVSNYLKSLGLLS